MIQRMSEIIDLKRFCILNKKRWYLIPVLMIAGAVLFGSIYFLVMTFLGQYIHPALKSKILPLFILTALLCAFIPVLGSLVGTCVFILIGIGILINLFRF